MELVAKYFNYGLRRPVCQKWVQANKVQVRNARSVPTRNLPTPKTERRLDVVILGYPNAGKSVLLNTLVEAKLAATTRKRHTTRSQILGVFNHKNVQLAFYDTPGFIRNSDATQNAVKQLRNIAAAATLNADVVLLVVDSSVNSSLSNVKDTFAEMVQIASDNPKTELILVLNKIDLVIPKTKLLDLVFDYVSLINGVKLGPEGAKKAKLDTTTFMVSGQDNDGVIDLKNYLIASAKSKKAFTDELESRTLGRHGGSSAVLSLRKYAQGTHSGFCAGFGGRLGLDDVGRRAGSRRSPYWPGGLVCGAFCVLEIAQVTAIDAPTKLFSAGGPTKRIDAITST